MAAIGAYLASKWVEWLFLALMTIFTFVIKHDFKLWKKDIEHQQKDFVDNLKTEIIKQSKDDDAILQGEIDDIKGEMSSLKAGILSIQGREFKAHCRQLLDPSHGPITTDEWEEITADHDAYNGLGGNHLGDQLYSSVEKKFNKNL